MNQLDRIIQIIRENMVANAPGTSGAYTSKGDPTTSGGFDTMLNLDGRSKVMRRLPKPYSKFLRKNKKG
jgi:hypothetical protein